VSRAARPRTSSESVDVAWWPVDHLPEATVGDLPARLARAALVARAAS
jgi:hypothetical protein